MLEELEERIILGGTYTQSFQDPNWSLINYLEKVDYLLAVYNS